MIIVTGTVNEPARITVDGVAAVVYGGAFTASDVLIVEGANVLAVTATDKVLSPLLDETGGGSFWLGRNVAKRLSSPGRDLRLFG